jgi:hypothetical protein
VALAREQEAQLTLEASTERARLDAEALAVRTNLDTAAETERTRAEAEVRSRIALAEEDFEITLRRRRTAESQASEQQIAEAQATAQRLVAEATDESARRVQQATLTVQGLRAQRDRVHADLGALHNALGGLITETARARAAELAATTAPGVPDQSEPVQSEPVQSEPVQAAPVQAGSIQPEESPADGG